MDFEIEEPTVYPVDLYYLMDLSYSMKDDLANVVEMSTQIGEYDVMITLHQFYLRVNLCTRIDTPCGILFQHTSLPNLFYTFYVKYSIPSVTSVHNAHI